MHFLEWKCENFDWNFTEINNIPSLVQIMAWRRPGDKPLSEPKMVNLLMQICVTWPQWVNWPCSQWLSTVIRSLFWLTSNQTSKLHIDGPLWGESTRPVMRKGFPCHDILMTYIWLLSMLDIALSFVERWICPSYIWWAMNITINKIDF